MKIVIAPDKFKGSLSSLQFCNVVEGALSSVMHDCDIMKLPLSDGGDGFADVISAYLGAKIQRTKVFDPLSREINSSWMISEDQKTAFIEMARASGLQLLNAAEYDCSLTSTFGTGQLIRAAMKTIAAEIIIGVGGSATNDGGMGMAAALGYRFLDHSGNELSPIGKNLIRLSYIDSSNAALNNNLRYIVACDVDNYICGEDGAARVFARQKGATGDMINELEEGMLNYVEVVKNDLGIDLSEIKGGGAAGGLAAGCRAFLKAEIINGADLILHYSHAEKYIQQSDLVITGEGKLDRQTLNGKLVARVCGLAKRYERKIFVICGKSEINIGESKSLGISKILQLAKFAKNEKDSIENANELLYKASLVLAGLIE
jgi:glycerate kinase